MPKYPPPTPIRHINILLNLPAVLATAEHTQQQQPIQLRPLTRNINHTVVYDYNPPSYPTPAPPYPTPGPYYPTAGPSYPTPPGYPSTNVGGRPAIWAPQLTRYHLLLCTAVTTYLNVNT